jgi:hypothetical protein
MDSVGLSDCFGTEPPLTPLAALPLSVFAGRFLSDLVDLDFLFAFFIRVASFSFDQVSVTAQVSGGIEV